MQPAPLLLSAAACLVAIKAASCWHSCCCCLSAACSGCHRITLLAQEGGFLLSSRRLLLGSSCRLGSLGGLDAGLCQRGLQPGVAVLQLLYLRRQLVRICLQRLTTVRGGRESESSAHLVRLLLLLLLQLHLQQVQLPLQLQQLMLQLQIARQGAFLLPALQGAAVIVSAVAVLWA
jgi:hypothetical protein